jgi:DNA-binding SARP family transcriptional activator/TolB-like protein
MAQPGGAHRFHLLGGLRVERGNGMLAGRASQKKRLAALALIAASTPNGVSRDVITALLWPESDTERARRRLSSTLYELRRSLGAVIRDEGDELHYDPAVLPCDFVAFQGAVERGDWAAAVDAYRGPFLDGVYLDGCDEFERWLTERRDACERQYAAALESLALEHEAAGLIVDAAHVWRRLAEHDPHSARIALCAMGALAAAGDRAGAVRLGTRHAERLQQELEIEPDPEVLARIRELRSEPVDGAPGLASPVIPSPHAVSSGDAARPATARTDASPREARSRTALLPAAPSTSAGSAGGQPASAGGQPRRTAAAALATGIGVVALLAWLLAGPRLFADAELPDPPGPLVVVLPFEDLGEEPQHYIAAGAADELTARLARVSALRVIGRATAGRFRGTGLDARQVGAELDADYVLVGSMRREEPDDGAARMRIAAQLIRVADGVHVWAELYDRTLAQASAVHAELAGAVVNALGVSLLESESEALTRLPTQNAEAYDYLLQGNAHGARRAAEVPARAAVALYERAVELEPDFAEALWRLVHGRVWLAWLTGEAEQRSLARQELDRLLALGEDRLEARLGRGWFLYYGERRYDEALVEFEAVRRLHPGDAEVVKTVGYLQRRLGQWDRAVATMQEALALSPLDHPLSYTLAQSLYWMGRYGEAEAYLERAILLAPDVATYHAHLVELHVARGDSVAARQALERSRTYGVPPAHNPRIELYGGGFDGAVDRILRSRPFLPGGHLQRFDALADAHARMGDRPRAATYADSMLHYAADVTAGAPDASPAEHAALATIYAGLAHQRLGRADSARSLVRRGLDAEAPFRDHVAGVLLRIAAARGYTRLGDHDAALDLLETLRSEPSPLSTADLRLDPEWDPLRGTPRFERLQSVP